MLRAVAPEVDASRVGELRCAALPQLRFVIQIGGSSASGILAFDDVPRLADSASVERLRVTSDQLQFDDPINIQFTSAARPGCRRARR